MLINSIHVKGSKSLSLVHTFLFSLKKLFNFLHC